MSVSVCLLSVTAGIWYSRKYMRMRPGRRLDSDQFPGQLAVHAPPLIPLAQNIIVVFRVAGSSVCVHCT